MLFTDHQLQNVWTLALSAVVYFSAPFLVADG